MKAILIDPAKREVRELDYNGDWHTIKEHLRCALFTIVGLYDKDGKKQTLYVDDEGLINGAWVRYGGFVLEAETGPHELNGRLPLAGYGLVLGTDDKGYATDTAYAVEEIRAMVEFMRLDEIRKKFAAGG